MKKRLFIAINLPENIKNNIKRILKESPTYYDDNLRFMEPENLHLTLNFLGYQSDDKLDKIIESIKDTTKKNPKLFIEFEKIIWGPPDKPARMIWISGTMQTSADLSKIKENLENGLKERNIYFEKESKRFNCHITLARFNTGKVNISEIKLPQIEKMSFYADSLDLMESHLKRNGARYENLASLSFGNQN